MQHNVPSRWIGSEMLGGNRYASIFILAYIALFLLISPLFPGVKWFQLGDFTLPVVNYYHAIMIPFALLLIILVGKIFSLPERVMKYVNLSVYPVLILTVLGLVFFYPAWAGTADEVFQALRDIIVFLDALVVIILMLMLPFRNRERFKQIWGAYILVLLTGISAEIAGMFGMILEYGNLYGFASIAFFNNYVTSLGGLDTFLGNAWTTHSHQMLPAVMGLIVGLSAVIFKYEKLSSRTRNIVNLGLVVSIFGTLSMTYLYWISSFGTYVIPAVFVSGAGGMNGLALDDSQTGIIGIGAMIALVGLFFAIRKNSENKWISFSMLGTWIGAMFAMVGVGYLIEFNETFYGFGSQGVPPDGGVGYQYDLAYTDGHLLLAFFMLTLLAGILIALHQYNVNSSFQKYVPALTIAGIVIGCEGLLVYTMTLSWFVEAIGLWLLVISIVLSPFIVAGFSAVSGRKVMFRGPNKHV